MSPFVEFLRPLLLDGSAVLAQRPVLAPDDRAAAAKFLAAEFAIRRLEVAGPPLDFDADMAVTAAGWVWSACWFLVSRREEAAEVEQALAVAPSSMTPAAHLSADLTLPFLPGVYGRARALAADDVLTRCLAGLLRRWPLSGVLSDVAEGPVIAPDFGGHPGLALLFAERLADHVKPAWVPRDGPARAYVELVFAERGLRLSL
jgi:hypothetical protein